MLNKWARNYCILLLFWVQASLLEDCCAWCILFDAITRMAYSLRQYFVKMNCLPWYLVKKLNKKNNKRWICERREDTCLANFTSYTTESISTRVAGEKLHLLMQNPRKLIIHCISRCIVGNSSIIFHEPHLNVLQVGKWNSPCVNPQTNTL